MTTVAFRDGVMAADSLAQIDSQIIGMQKLFIVRSAVIGGCGDAADIRVFIDWFSAGADTGRLPEFRSYRADDAPDFTVIVADESGLTRWTEYFQPTRINEPFYAIGSGSMFALGAMCHGASAEEAVRIAALNDVNTGGCIVTERVGK